MPKGYSTSGDILTRTRDGQDLNAIWADYVAALADYNAMRDPLVSLLTFDVTDPIEDIVQPVEEDFQEASEFGIPTSIRPQPVVTSRAWPFKWYDVRAGYTFQFLAGNGNTNGASTSQLDAIQNQAMNADNRLIFQQTMKALYNNANRTTLINNLSFPVTGLWNADGSYISPYNGVTFNGSTHQHYVATGSTQAWIFDPDDVTLAASLVEEHGYDRSNGYNIIILMNPADAAATVQRFVRNQAFSTSTVVSLYDFIPSGGQNMTVQLPPGYTLVGGLPDTSFAGLNVLGSWGPYLIVTNAQFPAGYMTAVAVAGQNTRSNVIGIRQHADAALRGVILKPGNNANYPLIDSYYIHGLGTGVGPRGAAAIMFNGASYTVPSQFVW